MNIRVLAKSYVESLQGRSAQALARIPFSLRFYPDYARTQALMAQVRAMDVAEVNRWTFCKLKSLAECAYAENRFYRVFYDRFSYHPDRLKSPAHFQDVPVVTKHDLVAFSL